MIIQGGYSSWETLVLKQTIEAASVVPTAYHRHRNRQSTCLKGRQRHLNREIFKLFCTRTCVKWVLQKTMNFHRHGFVPHNVGHGVLSSGCPHLTVSSPSITQTSAVRRCLISCWLYLPACLYLLSLRLKARLLLLKGRALSKRYALEQSTSSDTIFTPQRRILISSALIFLCNWVYFICMREIVSVHFTLNPCHNTASYLHQMRASLGKLNSLYEQFAIIGPWNCALR